MIFDLLNMKAVQASSCDLIGLFTFKWILPLNTPHHPKMRCDYPRQQQCETKRPLRKHRRNEGRRCTAVPHTFIFFSPKNKESSYLFGFKIYQDGIHRVNVFEEVEKCEICWKLFDCKH